MFDLNQQIARWKSAVAKTGACASDELQELESHLREEIAALVAAGLSEQEAFSESVSRLGDPVQIGSEFAKNESRFLCDSVVIRGTNAVVVLVGLAAVTLGLTIWLNRGDGLLAAHLGSITFAYVVSLLMALVGTYAIFRGAIVLSSERQFRDRFAAHCRFLLGVIALTSVAGTILGGMWAQRHWGRFWGWDLKEIGALSVVICSLVLYLLITKYNASTLHVAQATSVMSLVTFVAWFGPVVYQGAIGVSFLAVLVVALVVQLSILSMSLLLPLRGPA